MEATEQERRDVLRSLSARDHVLLKADFEADQEYGADGAAVHTVADVDTATAFSSKIKGSETTALALDIDLPAVLLPSSTPGHSHLYIDHEMTWDDYAEVLTVLGSVGILEPGYVAASLARKATLLRLPWVTKSNTPTDTKDEL